MSGGPSLDRSRVVQVLSEVTSLPTAPFHEQRVQRHVEQAAARLRLPSRRDAYGNVIVEYGRGRRAAVPMVFTAHMDHPGFEVVASGPRDALGAWHGMVPPFDMTGTRVLLHRGLDGAPVPGRIAGPVERSAIEATRPFPIVTEGPVGPGHFGHLRLVPFRMGRGRRGDIAYTKSADDLGGCAAILLLLEALVASRSPAHVLGVFTRAEEVGFYGALGLAGSKLLPRESWIVVLETSKALPQAVIGGGPVIRVGDRARIFDADLLHAMKQVAESLRGEDGGFSYQMRVMDGGTCEATPFCLAGYRAAGIAIPLGNYHNVGPRGVAPEYVSVRDLQAAVRLMGALACRAPEIPRILATQRRAIHAHLERKLRRLRTTARTGI